MNTFRNILFKKNYLNFLTKLEFNYIFFLNENIFITHKNEHTKKKLRKYL